MKTSNVQPGERQNSGQRIPLSLPVALLTALAFWLAGYERNARGDQQVSETDSPAAASIVIPVEGMSCAACVARVKKALKAIKGVSEVRVSLEKREMEIRYESKKTSPEKLAKAIDDLGYKAGTPRKKEKSP